MSQLSQTKLQKTTVIEWEGELNDADLMAVTGGGLIDGLLGGVAATNNAIGNGGTPTTGTVAVVAGTVTGLGADLTKINGGLEGGFQELNGTVTGAAGAL